MESEQRSYERITSADRARIEEMINEGSPLASIASDLGKDPTSISREVKRNRVELPRVSTSKFMRNPCAERERCEKRGLCKARGCRKLCAKCERVLCRARCPEFSAWRCGRIARWPYVCNRCARRPACPERRWSYDGGRAARISDSRASLSRKGFGVDVVGLERIDSVVSPLLKRGRSPYHIWNSHREDLGIRLSTPYAYVDAGAPSAGRTRLARAARTRRRRERRRIKDKRGFTGRAYEGCLAAMGASCDGR